MPAPFRHACITGATSGIGEALAHLLASKEIPLTLVGRREKKLEELKERLGAEKILVADLGTEEGRQKVISEIHHSTFDLLINNAGFGLYGKGVDLPTEEQVAILEVNGRAVLELTLEAAKRLVAQKKEGVILNVSSVGGEHPTPGMSVYGASKSFVTQLSLALNSELKPKGVHVLVSCPGMVATDFQNRAARRKMEVSGKDVMDVTFAAQEIWRQIEKREEKRIFNWRYRLGSYVAKHFAPLSFVKRLVWRRIKKRI